MAQQRYATVYLFFVLAILFNWHKLTQALAFPPGANLKAKSLHIAAISSSHNVMIASAVTSNGNIISPTRQLTQRTPSSEQRKAPSALYTSSRMPKFARSQPVTSIIKEDLISALGAATGPQPSSQSYATSTRTPSRTSPTPYPTTLRTVSTHPSVTTASTPLPMHSTTPTTLSPVLPTSPSSASTSPLTTAALLPQPLSLSLLIPLILILAIIVILLSLLIRSSRSTLQPTQRRPRSEHIHASALLEVPSTESTVVTCREIYELPGAAPWGDRERCGEGTKELEAGWWVAEMG
ncbi:hypothetical protein MMC32_002263 [Xylographa parallela]|nr:hypothetical protein [Xylographa parallela]